jgi:lipoprotein-anchoring transpeptidase ErfK/SrfK
MNTCAIFLICISLGESAALLQGAEPTPDRKQIEQNTRLQIFLDNANFGPGKIDGRGGEFTKKALALYNRAKGLADSAEPDISSLEPALIPYTITKEDLESVGELPSGPVAQAKMKRLPYASVLEAVAERFHSSQEFLRELNPGAPEKPHEGDRLTVPHVKPFVLSEVKNLQPGSEAAAVIANDLGEEEQAKSGTEPPPSPAAPANAEVLSVTVSTKDEMLEVHAGDKIVAAFPVTVGSQQTASPIGHWTVKAVAKMPTFRYDLKMLKEGERSADFHLLPPGPNNPVGVVWIALSKKGIGLHGTSDPESIGRSASHGCIRLANWDIVKLAEMVKPGVAVTVE